MKKKKSRKKAVLLTFLILIVFLAALSMPLLKRYDPSGELADAAQLYGVKEDQVALVLNKELQEDRGIYADGTTYLPLTWVNERLNDRFFWDDVEQKMVYALPDRIVMADRDTADSQGRPLIKLVNGRVYIPVELVLGYTDIRVSAFDQEPVRRLFIDDRWEPEPVAVVRWKGKVRTRGGIKSPIVTVARRGSKVRIIEAGESWSKVVTANGHIGYIRNLFLRSPYEEMAESDFVKPVYTSRSLGEEVCLAWHQVLKADDNQKMKELVAGTKGINVISPTWFALTDNEGNYRSLASKEYVDEAHGMGLQVWALLDNLTFTKDVQTKTLMTPTSNRRKLIRKLMQDVEAYGLDGINLDVESIAEEAGPPYVQFIRELSIECRKKGIVLSVDNTVPMDFSMFYNRREQGIVADYVIVMAYDEHYGVNEAGSVASIGFVEEGIKNTLKEVPKEKIINAVPFYTRIWKEEGDELAMDVLGISAAKAWVEKNQVELYWQEEPGQYYGELKTEEGRKYFWMEEERSLGLKMDLIEKYDLAGVACWRLGLEPEEIWDVIGK